MFHINIKNFHNNDRPNKIELIILSQLKITKVNIIENLERKTTKSLQKMQEYEKERQGKKRDIIFYCAFCLP